MFKNITKHITEGSTFAGLEISKSTNGDCYRFIEIKKVGTELIIDNSCSLKQLEDINLHLKKTTPLFLCINNDAVLTKELSNSSTSADTALVNEAFPNLEIKSFYWELIQKSTKTIVSISRKDTIERLLLELEQYNIKPFQFCLGIASIKNISAFIEENTIDLINYKVQINEGNLAEIIPQETSDEEFYSINGLKLSNYNLLSFGQILGYLSANERNTNFSDKNLELTHNIKNERIFQKVGKLALAIFTILLLTNFVWYNFYFDKVNKLNTQISANSSQNENLLRLENSVKKKQERVKTISTNSNSKATYYIDVLAQTIPKTILLNSIKYQPLLKNIKDKKPILLDNEIILVSGISKDINEFSNWVEELENITWIESIETLDYDFVKKNTSSFVIEIKKND